MEIPTLPKNKKRKTELLSNNREKRTKMGDSLIPDFLRQLLGISTKQVNEEINKNSSYHIHHDLENIAINPDNHSRIAFNEENVKECDLANIRSSLKKSSTSLRLAMLRYQKQVEKTYFPYIGYPYADRFKEYQKDAEEAAKRKDHSFRLKNEALSFIAEFVLKRVDLALTQTPEFQSLQNLYASQTNTQDVLDDTDQAIALLKKLQSPTASAMYWPAISKAVAQHIDILNQKHERAEKFIEEQQGKDQKKSLKLEQISEQMAVLQNFRQHLEVAITGNISAEFADVHRVSEIFAENKKYVQFRMKRDADQARKLLDELSDRVLNGQDVQNIRDKSRCHLAFYAGNRPMLMVNGVCMYVKEIRKFKHDEESGETTIHFRRDIAKIRIFGERKYTKRMQDIEAKAGDELFSLKIPGITHKEDERLEAEIEQKKLSPQKNSDELWENITIFPHKKKMESLEEVNVEVSKTPEGKNEIVSRIVRKTMPSNNKIKDDDIMTGYPREMIQHFHRMNLEKDWLVSADNKFRFPLSLFDGTEFLEDPENGATFVTEFEYRYLCPKILAELSYSLGNLNKEGENLQIQARAYHEQLLDFLNKAVETKDRNSILSVLRQVKKGIGEIAAETSEILYEIKNPPKNREDYEVRDPLAKSVAERAAQGDAEAMHGAIQARNALDQEIHKRVQDVLNKPFPDAKAREQLLAEIRAAYHLDSTYGFPLLMDPNKGTEEIKCAHPDLHMFLDEYRRYLTKKSLTDKEKEYVQKMEDFVQTTDDPYLKNDFYLTKASISGNDVEKLNQLFAALNGLKRVNAPRSKDNFYSLGDLRKNDEHHWVKYITKGIQRADIIGVDNSLQTTFHKAVEMQESRSETVRLAEEALLGIFPKDALKHLEEKPMDELPDPIQIAEHDVQSIEQELAQIAKKADKLIKDCLENGNAGSYAMELQQLSLKAAIGKYHIQLFLAPPCARKDLHANALKIIEDHEKFFNAKCHEILTLVQSDRRQKLALDAQKKMLKYILWVNLLAHLADMRRLSQFSDRLGNGFMRFLTDLYNGIAK